MTDTVPNRGGGIPRRAPRAVSISCRSSARSLSHFKSTLILSPIAMGYGVSPGSILSQILFLVYENDIGSSHVHGKLVQYADNTTLYFNGKLTEILEEQDFVDFNSCVQHI